MCSLVTLWLKVFVQFVFTAVPLAEGLAMAISTRRAKNRYRYSSKSNSGFIEVNCLLTPNELRNRLLELDEVASVVPHRKGSKEVQGNYGDHWQSTNWEVAVTNFDGFLEFEVTKHDHMSETQGIPQSRTVMFREPPEIMRKVAWDILIKAVGDIALFPMHVLAWYQQKFDTSSMWEVYKDDLGGIWWHNPLLPLLVVRPHSEGWQIYRTPNENDWWMMHEETEYFFWCHVRG